MSRVFVDASILSFANKHYHHDCHPLGSKIPRSPSSLTNPTMTVSDWENEWVTHSRVLSWILQVLGPSRPPTIVGFGVYPWGTHDGGGPGIPREDSMAARCPRVRCHIRPWEPFTWHAMSLYSWNRMPGPQSPSWWGH